MDQPLVLVTALCLEHYSTIVRITGLATTAAQNLVPPPPVRTAASHLI
ncbi:unnamed protein product [Amoebophrya sp. A25]|nr:unnamed protein product [Amoebophrya sp. A25]|eukprot:GSA25T00002724001.1